MCKQNTAGSADACFSEQLRSRSALSCAPFSEQRSGAAVDLKRAGSSTAEEKGLASVSM